MRSFVAPVVALSIAVFTPVGTGCATEPPADVGTIQIPLQQVGADGALYHLSAEFQVVGPAGTQVIDATGFTPSVTLELPPGITTVELLAGWTLEKSVNGGISYAPVSALLGTLNPSAVRVVANFSSTLSFQFIVRSTQGMLTVQFGVTLQPRELAGGMVVGPGADGDFAGYSNARLDYAIYHDLSALERLTLGDGTKRLQFTAGAVAAEFFNDAVGLLAGTIGPSMAGGFLQYHFDANPDGTQSVAGELDGFSDPFPVLTFGPHTFEFTILPLDDEGFPTDQFFLESVPFNMTGFFASGEAHMAGVLRFRSIPVTN